MNINNANQNVNLNSMNTNVSLVYSTNMALTCFTLGTYI